MLSRDEGGKFFIEKHWKVRGRDCGDVPAAWLTQFMGEPLRQKYLGFKLNENPPLEKL